MQIHQFIVNSAKNSPKKNALYFKKESLNYETLQNQMEQCASGLLTQGISKGERIGIYLPKQFETVISFFAASMAGTVFVPINPLLKPEQVAYILKDCNVRILITSSDRLTQLEQVLGDCHDLFCVIDVNNIQGSFIGMTLQCH